MRALDWINAPAPRSMLTNAIATQHRVAPMIGKATMSIPPQHGVPELVIGLWHSDLKTLKLGNKFRHYLHIHCLLNSGI